MLLETYSKRLTRGFVWLAIRADNLQHKFLFEIKI